MVSPLSPPKTPRVSLGILCLSKGRLVVGLNSKALRLFLIMRVSFSYIMICFFYYMSSLPFFISPLLCFSIPFFPILSVPLSSFLCHPAISLHSLPFPSYKFSSSSFQALFLRYLFSWSPFPNLPSFDSLLLHSVSVCSPFPCFRFA